MYKFNIELADTVAEIDALFESSQALCKDYITDKPAEISIVISKNDIEKEKKYTSIINPSLQNLEYMALYRRLCTELAHKDTVLIHGSCITVDGKAYLFCAPSGTGKSTHTRLWRQYLGDRAIMINDDKPLIRVTGDSVKIFGTPWNGKHRLGFNISAPLRSICFLYRGSVNTIEKAAQKEILPFLLKYTFRPESPADMLDVLNTASKVAKLCDFWSLKCNMSLEAASVAYSTMSS